MKMKNLGKIARIGRPQLLCVLASLLVANSSLAGSSRVYPPTKKWAGALRMTEIMALATRGEIQSLGIHYDHIIASGIRDSDLRDGSLAVGRVYCCGPTDKGLAMWLHIPQGIEVEVGDIVEVRMGSKPRGGDTGRVNTATRVRVKKEAADKSCRWVPPDENLWRRTLYCDCMEAEGWIFRGGMYKTWMKPASSLAFDESIEERSEPLESANAAPMTPIAPLDLPAQLFEAAEKGQLQRVTDLLSGGVDVNAKNSDGGTALMLAAYGGHPEVVRLLLEKGADVNVAMDVRDRATALMVAASMIYNGEVLKLLLENGSIDVNVAGSDGQTALMYAAGWKEWETVSLLLAHPQIDVNKTDSAGLTALDHAKGSQVKKLLKDAGAKKGRAL